MDITKLFGKVFQVVVGGKPYPVFFHGGYMQKADINWMFNGSSALVDGVMRQIYQIHLYPFNPSVVRRAKEEGYDVIEVRKNGRSEEEVPSFVAFSHSEGCDDGFVACVISEDIDQVCQDNNLDFWAIAHRR
jgi:hypothetical protein